MADLFDELCKIVEKVDPDFDRENSKDVEIMTKSFILAMQEREEGKEMKKDYFRVVVEPSQKGKMENLIKKNGNSAVKIELAKLNFEKEILEKRIEVTKKFLN